MSTRDEDNGGPAFPVADLSKTQAPGMSLRDWFAGQALRVVVALPGRAPVNGRGTIYDSVAQDAYAMADAMLTARTAPATRTSEDE